MTTINISDALMAVLQSKKIANKDLVLITDDGGGKYSLHGGACTIGTKFTLIYLDQPDPAYSEPLTNNQGLKLWTSSYDLMFFNPGIAMDYDQGRISIKDDAHMLDNGVQIADGAEVVAAFKRGTTAHGTSC